MAFRFPLLGILRLRQSLERQEEQKLIALLGEAQRLRRAMAQLEDERLRVQRAALEQLADGGAGAELQFTRECDVAYQRVRRELQRQLNAAEARRREQMNVYRGARQGREILDGLRERQQGAYALEFARREQQSADEAFLLRLPHDAREVTEPSDHILPSATAESA
jgi:flagellar export protein FliJ